MPEPYPAKAVVHLTMCLILFSFDPNAKIPLVVAANRDEFFARPTANAGFWQDHPQILAGQDLVGGGTWLGMTRTGRFAAVTNVREPNVVVDNPLSRGDLTRDFLSGSQSCADYLESIQEHALRYSGFNLLVGELNQTTQELFYFSNRKQGINQLSAGTYGLSNHLLDSSWPKVSQGKVFLQNTLDNSLNQNTDELVLHDKLREFLEDPSLASDEILPKTGVSYEREKALSAAFITLPDYGTRTSTVLTINNGTAVFSEKNYLEKHHLEKKSDEVVELKDSQFFTIDIADNNHLIKEKKSLSQ